MKMSYEVSENPQQQQHQKINNDQAIVDTSTAAHKHKHNFAHKNQS